MADETIGPALTPDEWAWTLSVHGSDLSARADAIEQAVNGPATPRFHMAAAIALHGQPFGFTWADIDALLDMMDDARVTQSEAVQPLYEKIVALLPPKESV